MRRFYFVLFVVTFAAALLSAIIASGDEMVKIRLSAGVVQTGNTLQITCTVPRHESNRKLGVGIVDDSASERDLEGASAPVTHYFRFKPSICGENIAYCLIARADGSTALAKQTFQTTGLFCQ
jgi:hypothetical protein